MLIYLWYWTRKASRAPLKEKTENFLEVNRLLRDLNKRVAMDLVVMTRTQWERFIEMDSGFLREVQEKGLLLIGRGHSGETEPNLYRRSLPREPRFPAGRPA